MTTPAVAAVRRNFPHAHISILVVPWVADVFRCNPHVDDVILYRRNDIHQGLKGKWKLMNELKQRSFDLAILLQNAFEAALIAMGARIPRRAGYNTDGRGLLLTHPVKMRREYKRIHETQYYLTMLRGLGLEAPDAPLLLDAPPEYEENVRTELEAMNGAGIPLVALAPGATYGSAKMWPAARYGQLAERIARELNARLVVLGSEKERAIGEEILGWVTSGPVWNLCGSTDLLTAVAWIKQAALFISNDSGLMHVAAALARPQVAIFGSTDRVTTSPKNPHARLVYHDVSCAPCLKTKCPTDHRCMEMVTVDEVFEAACEVLKKGRI